MNNELDDVPKMAEEPVIEEPETRAVVKLKGILREVVLIKKYAFEKNDERIYLCADNIERELQKVRYLGAILDNEWW